MIEQSQVEALEVGLIEIFSDAEVESHYIFDRSVVLFRIYDRPRSPFPELEITEEALEDHEADTILIDLVDHEVPERLGRDPSMRLCYYTRRSVPPAEVRYVRCDGRLYRIVRDEGHNVRVFDSADRPLENLPPTLLVLRSSLYQRSQDELCSDVHKWRGSEQ